MAFFRLLGLSHRLFCLYCQQVVRGTRSIVSVPFHLYIVLACVENTFLAALLTIIIKKNDYVNLRILTSFSFFEQGDFS
jgi:hypothetical protein